MANRSNLPDVRREGGLWNPFREMSRLQEKIDRIFDEFSFPAEEQFSPAVDVDETESHYSVTFDLPGLKKDEIKIQVQDNQLIVSGERKKEQKKEAKGRFASERYYGTFMRSFVLPTNVDADKVEAIYDNGVLQVLLPKSEISKPKEIPVKEGKQLKAA